MLTGSGRLPTQSSIDFVSLQKPLRTSFAELDLVSSSGFFLFSARPDGRPDFDPTAMIYQGTSMGGVLGAAFLSITPEPLPAAAQMALDPGDAGNWIEVATVNGTRRSGIHPQGRAQRAVDQRDAGPRVRPESAARRLPRPPRFPPAPGDRRPALVDGRRRRHVPELTVRDGGGLTANGEAHVLGTSARR